MYTVMLLVILNQPGSEPQWFKTSWQVKDVKTCLKIAHQYYNKQVPYELGGTVQLNGYCYKPVDFNYRG